ncbi:MULTISPECIES: MoaD/ThiS family protein [unclassified Janthinobacterium]|uniref:MoaD/ThiS family protein n=1 Tax=unclassified Janthinobacterium TaxID=2610881 RepID=UPI001E2C54B2|nr:MULTISPECIES: MoaD/ThiS family protein [unclassified Janthinobacterium]MCC7644721.1 MoaD/ThiS family protein [Janthinobacterium sp. EB271-G4-3-1]MCC7691803.1 MoaD/ThiS family protein [Janthinobacterium sp. EB271-G4-3-2]
MAHLHFTQQLARFLDVPTVDVDAPRLRAALDAAFVQQPRLRGYVLDEQGALRPNVAIFIDGVRCRERCVLDDVLLPDSQVYILQALSGG